MNLPKTASSKLVLMAIAALVAILIATASTSPSHQTPPSPKPRQLIAVIPADAPPTSYRSKESGKAEGFAVESMEEIGARLNLQISYLFVNNWEEVTGKLVHGEADIAPDMAITPERMKLLDFTTPLEVISIRYFVRHSKDWSDRQINHAHIGVMKGSAAGELLKDRPGIQLFYYNTYINALYELLSGKIDAFAGPEPTIRKLLQDAALEERIKTAGKPLTEIKRCIATRKGNSELLAQLEPAVQDLIGSPAYRTIHTKWYGKPSPFWDREKIQKAAILFLVITIILLSAWRYAAMTKLNHKLSEAMEERKKTEEALRNLNEELEQRVLNRTAELQSALNHHESFTYSISHDLRAPLRAIDGYSAMLTANFSSMLPAERNVYLEKMAVNARKMGHLIDALLAFSRFNRQPLAPRAVDITSLVQQILVSFAEERLERHIIFTIGALPPCTADPILIREVIYNLIANAVKFTRNQETPCIELGAAQQNGKTVYFVKDNGIGFDMEFYDKLFGICQRLHGMEEFEGTGVGLAIAKNIIDRHGGKIWAEGEPGQGGDLLLHDLRRKILPIPETFKQALNSNIHGLFLYKLSRIMRDIPVGERHHESNDGILFLIGQTQLAELLRIDVFGDLRSRPVLHIPVVMLEGDLTVLLEKTD